MFLTTLDAMDDKLRLQCWVGCGDVSLFSCLFNLANTMVVLSNLSRAIRKLLLSGVVEAGVIAKFGWQDGGVTDAACGECNAALGYREKDNQCVYVQVPRSPSLFASLEPLFSPLRWVCHVVSI
jgi:hypothetical protein